MNDGASHWRGSFVLSDLLHPVRITFKCKLIRIKLQYGTDTESQHHTGIREFPLTVFKFLILLYLKCPQSIYRWFKGETLPTVDHLIVLAHRMKLRVEEFIVLKNESVTGDGLSAQSTI